ncbi:MAG: hypothetical protein ACI8RZ_007368 [Myxococcota bacterium]|jgi:hypothetical protein
MPGIRSHLQGGKECKGADMEPCMRDSQASLSNSPPTKQEDVEIHRPIRPTQPSPAPQPRLNVLASDEELLGRAGGVHADCGVEEHLLRGPQRSGLPDPTDRDHLDIRQGREGGDRQREQPAAIPQRAAQSNDRGLRCAQKRSQGTVRSHRSSAFAFLAS